MNTSNELNKEKPTITRLIITSDPQYPWTPAMDDGNSKESDNEKKRVSESLIREQYNSINAYIYTRGAAPVIINGDITAYGHTWQRNKMNQIFDDVLTTHHFYGLGNHDIENNIDDCFRNECTAGSLSTYVNHIDKMPDKYLDERDIRISGSLTQKYYEGCFGYSIILGEIYSIQLNNYPTMELNIRSYNSFFKMNSTLDWLEKVLKKAKSLEKTIIVNIHKPDGWKSERFTKLIEYYGVKAVFAGHYHTILGLQTNYQENFGSIPVFLSGSASQKTYLILEQTEQAINIYSVRNNNFENKILEASIMVGNYKIKTALNNTSGVDVSATGNMNVHLYQDNNTKRHQWRLFYNARKEAYQITNLWYERVLTWDRFNNSRNVLVTKNEHKDEQYWILENIENGYFIIKNKMDENFVLNVEGGKIENNTNIQVHERNETNAQRFKLKPVIIQGVYKIKTALNGTSGVDVSNSGNKNVHLYQDNTITRSHWKFQYNKDKDAYQIVNLWYKNEVMAWNDYKGSKNVFVTKNQYKDEHYWKLEDVGNDYYIIKNYKDSNLVLHVVGANTNNTTNIQVHEKNKTNAQKFKLVQVDSVTSYHQQHPSEQESENNLQLNS